MSVRLTREPIPQWISSPYPHQSACLVGFPSIHVLLVTLNRPEVMNCLTMENSIELALLWRWYDNEPSLRCAVFTGAGDMVFCSGENIGKTATTKGLPAGGLTGMSNRDGKKPIVVACNGHAHGKFRWDTDRNS